MVLESLEAALVVQKKMENAETGQKPIRDMSSTLWREKKSSRIRSRASSTHELESYSPWGTSTKTTTTTTTTKKKTKGSRLKLTRSGSRIQSVLNVSVSSMIPENHSKKGEKTREKDKNKNKETSNEEIIDQQLYITSLSGKEDQVKRMEKQMEMTMKKLEDKRTNYRTNNSENRRTLKESRSISPDPSSAKPLVRKPTPRPVHHRLDTHPASPTQH